ncbi:hypothetical protein [Nocardia jejuensis]|uniref:hypothetical protein n=1 Tax=Nocardia jejuensis TaxID=328049 RepID=UPI0008344A4E|nr:hypothetical protein [Nocardia jejuensis]
MSDHVFRDGPARYATGQLQRALEAVAVGADADARARAQRKVRRWREVLDGVSGGTLEIGSRTPVAKLPAWATLEVVHGGFATGRASADVAASPGELDRLPGEVPGGTDRERVNLWYLSDAGQAELLNALRAGRYRIEVPEEAALAVVALLLDKGFAEQALNLVAELRPFMSRLRFTPAFHAVPRPAGDAVRVASVGEVVGALRAVRTPEQLRAMHTTIEVWTPLYDRLVALWCGTVEGVLPSLENGAVHGGWPCRVWPEDWAERRARWLTDFTAARRDHGFAGRHAHPRSNFARLHEALVGCARDSAALNSRQVGWVRRALANTLTHHDEPGSDTRELVRMEQASSIAEPLYADLAGVLAARLDRYPAGGGLPSPEEVEAPVSPADTVRVADGTVIPQHLRDKAIRALEATPGELIDRGIIGSGEVLAAVLPQLTSRLLAADIADPAAAGLMEQLYTAFRQRRSLLLVGLQNQVGFDELPWATALKTLRDRGDDAPAVAARELLARTALLAVESFPEAVLPNPLVREFRTLAERAGLRLPLVEEVAADIFMGTFTDKWRVAAATASRVLEGTLYQRYYDLPSADHWETESRKGKLWGKSTAEGFAELCTARSAEAGAGGSWVAANGAVLEQSQILTTHNLAVLVDALDLGDRLRAVAPALARSTFEWILRRLDQPARGHAALIQRKNAAYAWRQALFLLSYCDAPTQREEIRRIHTRTANPILFPYTRGLEHIADGGRFTSSGTVPHGPGRRFLGWTVSQR